MNNTGTGKFKKGKRMEVRKTKLCFYQIDIGEDLIAFLGSTGIKKYGLDKNGNVSQENHYHNLLEIGICRWGNGNIILKNQEFDYADGTLIVIPPNYSHRIVSTKEKCFWEFIYLNPAEFLSDYMESWKVKELVGKISSRPIVKRQSEISLFARELDCLMDQIRIQESGYKNCIKGLIYTLFMEIIKVNSQAFYDEEPVCKGKQDKLEKLQKAMCYVEEHYAEEIKVSDIAEAAYISETYLRKLFAENYNMTPIQYVDFTRIHAACRILQREVVTISDVAHRVGFGNMSTFIRNFKSVTGKTPKLYAWENGAVSPKCRMRNI